MKQSIDVVITWVDGSDPILKQKKSCHDKHLSVKMIPSSKEVTRFINNGELGYCLQSLMKNATWIRKIFIVTDGQKPMFLPDSLLNDPKIEIIDHLVIFREYEEVLPTFNSISIESVIHRIPNLSEKYIYLNDDFIILKPVYIEDFFSKDNVVLKGHWSYIKKYGSLRLLLSQMLNLILKKLFKINRSMSLLQQMKSAELAGFKKRYFKSPHYPHPQIKNTISLFYEKNHEIFFNNIKHRFRNLEQHVSIFLSNHLEIINDNAVLQPDNDCMMICFNRDSEKLIRHKIHILANSNEIKFLCIQSFEEASSEQSNRLLHILEKKYMLAYH
ncbi:stealth family protein [Acinetobacter zhairhuonensis]|uniref:stealth family protein n=1 Tax=Acinetobacter sp. A7.4 TaxID=2919921 RepID=UPI001F4F8CE7|nr:stealth family protein [Acinetobacter sp. A7.4]MCJ8161412.1 stealth family protein [Acinetobacter sp. A7.4]